jgi:F420H(2)-dependent quinone reductase
VAFTASSGLPLRVRLALSGSQLASRRGVYLGRRSAKILVALCRRTGAKLGGHLPGLPVARIVLVEHVGAKSGAPRTSPLIFHELDGVVAVVASGGGQPTHPACSARATGCLLVLSADEGR